MGQVSPEPRIPPSEADLPTFVAKPWFSLDDKTPALGGKGGKVILEGPAFDKQGNLLFVDCVTGRILRLSPNRELTTVLSDNPSGIAGIAIHPDGRIFVAGFTDPADGGTVFTIKPDGSGKQVIIEPSAGYVPDDIAIDSEGGFYFSDMRGDTAELTGGVLYVAPDMKTVTPLLTGMSLANGVALSPDHKILWATETGRGILHRIDLATPGKIAPYGATFAYHFTAAKVDSLRSDERGNLYAALYSEGRVLVFDPRGVPIGQILIPDREQGEFLGTTSMAIEPGSGAVYIVAHDRDGRRARIYRAELTGDFSKPARR
ncbi:lactonase drp35 [Novosphingobium colocasiae]|uniref:Lactonase drp35 n=2 Tax=Novosphingobium colocasiae TaxID=1256513 RepID=A0A918UK84_9SPHN|nr:lactonase drp35 [Novosphingobium colocasiae]